MKQLNQLDRLCPAPTGKQIQQRIGTRLGRHLTRGFSLVELLVVIAVIGILAAIAMPSLSNINDNTEIAAAKNQAQNIASVFSAGSSAGAPGFRGLTSKDAAINAVGVGSNGAGALSGTSYRVAGVSASMDSDKPENQQAKYYLKWQSDTLVYDPVGGATDPDLGWRDHSEHGTPASAQPVYEDLVQHNPNVDFRIVQKNGKWVVQYRG